VVGVLALLALALITLSFRESQDGPMHSVEQTASAVVRPFQVAVERVARPFRDAYGWASDVMDAKGDAEKLRSENQVLRQQVIQNESALRENVRLRALLHYARGPSSRATTATCRGGGRPSSERVPAGDRRRGRHERRRQAERAVGHERRPRRLVTRVFSNRARVTLITDEQSAVSAVDLRTDADGIVRHGRGAGDTLVLDRVAKQEFVKEGDEIVTAGWRSDGFSSL
jgi:rod shape-determining protein MreC